MRPTSSRSSNGRSTRSGDAGRFLDLLFSDRQGYVAVALGIAGFFNERGTYKFLENHWDERYFFWPTERKALISWVEANADDADVYVNPTLRIAKNRKGRAHSCSGSHYCWADVDDLSKDTARRIDQLMTEGSFIVESGHGLHVYIKLYNFVCPDVLETLNELVAAYLPADSKWSETAMLRVPGTQNQKGRAAGGSALPVVLDVSTEAPRHPWSPEKLRRVLERRLEASEGSPLRGSKQRTRGSQRKTIEPADPEPLPSDLPSDTVAMLADWGGSSRRDRSLQLFKLVLRLVQDGYRDGQIITVARLHEPAQEKWSIAGDLDREIQRCIDRVRGGAANVVAIWDHFRRHYRSGRTLASDSKIFDVLVWKSVQLGHLGIDMSVRDLCLRAGLGSTNTVEKSLSRLITAGYLKRVPTAAGPGTHMAHRYRLVLPQGDKVETHNHISSLALGGCVSTLSPLDPAHDVWAFGGLQKCRRTYETLISGSSNVLEISRQLGLCRKTVNRHLAQLAEIGMAEQKPNGEWVPFDRNMDEVAQELGVTGVGAKRAKQIELKREAFHLHLAMERIEMENFQQEQIHRGFVAIPKTSILVNPGAARNLSIA